MHPYTDEQVARVCHEANRALQYAHGDALPSQPWDAEDPHIKASAIEGVRNARNGQTPRQLHDSWMQFKLTEGWRYGPEKDWAAKTHPCLMPYEDLPQRERDKDALFQLIVTALTAGL